MMKGISLFSSAGIGELFVSDANIDIVLANELIPKRAECYEYLHPHTKMYCGDINDDQLRNELIEETKKQNVKFLLATPPCQGVSSLGKNKKQEHFVEDPRNYLVFRVFEFIDSCDFDYILIENTPRFLEMLFPYNGELQGIVPIIMQRYGRDYAIEYAVLNAKDYGICQSRPRAFIKIFKRDRAWPWPEKQPEITLQQAIGDLPSLNDGEDSGIKWHYAKKENPRTVLALKHTAPGHSALTNPVYYPKKEDGTRIRGFHNTFKRMVWDAPCPTRTTYCGSMSSHNNVHPGRLLPDGTYSDARVLTMLETFIVSSIPKDIVFPEWANDTFLRTVIGEGVPPKLLYSVITKMEM
ncbi:MAG: DNA cytosine methyltransferase [Candidatus Cloacimonetes bacterium]|nr:DNA cytosine methyltransferase [Candidatus Cloacimonadota bacterium]